MSSHHTRNELLPLIALCAAFLLVLVTGNCRGADSMIEGFFSPEQIVKSRDQIGLTDAQMTTLKSAFEDAQQRVQGLQQGMDEGKKKMAELAGATRVDEKAVVAEADKMLDVEREMKHAQLTLLVLIKNTLTAEQQAKLKELTASDKSSSASLESKMAQVKEAVQRWQQEGRDLTPLMEIKTEIQSLVAQGKNAEVSAALDRALKILNGSGADK